MKGIGLGPHSSWARFNDGKRTLWLCDSLSFMPTALERIAGMVKLDKSRLPDDDAPDDEWLRRCRGDVEILRIAVLRMLRFFRAEDLGDFRLTGSAQATAAFRHRFLKPKSLLVHSNPEAIDAERRAAFAGRCEVWRHGKVRGPIHEYDFTAAYASIASRCEVPSRIWGEHSVLPAHRMRRLREHKAILVDVFAKTGAPTVPASYGGRIVWPIGEFKTTLWDCELDLLESEGGSYEVERLWIYDRGPALKEWADWILAALEGNPPGDDPLQSLILKHWSRALVGRFGLRYPILEDFATDSRFDLAMYPVVDGGSGAVTNHLQIGQQVWEQSGMVESGNSIPMVMSWIMAKARCELWQAMKVLGLENILYVDTDGLLTTIDLASPSFAHKLWAMPNDMRRKNRWTSADLRSPRNIDTDDERRIAGVPRKSSKIKRGTYQAEVWETLPGALRARRPGSIVVSERMFSVSDRDPRRIHLAGGHTEAIRLSIEAQAGNPPSEPAPLTAALSAP